MRPYRFAFLLAGMLLAACAQHVNAPAGRTPLPETRFRVEQGVVFKKGADGTRRLYADLYTPITLGPYPTVLAVPGGGWEGGHPKDMRFVAEYLAQRGLAVMAIQHRGAGGGVGLGEQIADLHAALRWIRSKASAHRLDTERLAVLGFESGGHLGAMLALAQSARRPLPGLPRDPSLPPLRAVVAGGAALNLLPAADRPEARRLLPDTSERTLRQASPVFAAHAEAPPFFLFHGDRDGRWPIAGAEAMLTELQQLGVHAELYRMKGRGHTTTYLTVSGALSAAAEFLWRELEPY
jgi:acetyl esterase/lipase